MKYAIEEGIGPKEWVVTNEHDGKVAELCGEDAKAIFIAGVAHLKHSLYDLEAKQFVVGSVGELKQ